MVLDWICDWIMSSNILILESRLSMFFFISQLPFVLQYLDVKPSNPFFLFEVFLVLVAIDDISVI